MIVSVSSSLDKETIKVCDVIWTILKEMYKENSTKFNFSWNIYIQSTCYWNMLKEMLFPLLSERAKSKCSFTSINFPRKILQMPWNRPSLTEWGTKFPEFKKILIHVDSSNKIHEKTIVAGINLVIWHKKPICASML